MELPSFEVDRSRSKEHVIFCRAANSLKVIGTHVQNVQLNEQEEIKTKSFILSEIMKNNLLTAALFLLQP
jgi:hypothetical protein